MTAALALILASLLTPVVSAEDLLRFPSEEVTQQMSLLADRHRDWTAVQIQFHPEDPGLWQARYQDACWRASVWDQLLYAHWNNPDYKDGVCYRLAQLRSLIGYAAYYQGQMPCPLCLESLDIH
jgi:hypothetical protein